MTVSQSTKALYQDGTANAPDRQCVILGAGAPHHGDTPALLHETINGVRVLQWILDAFGVQAEQAALVVGYKAAEIQARYADLRLIHNPLWEKTGSGMSLLQANLEATQPLYACYGDVLFRSGLIEALDAVDAPIAVAWDSAWRHRYAGRGEADLHRCEKVVVTDGRATRLGSDIPTEWASGEFIGLVRFSPEAVARLATLQRKVPESLQRCHLSGLIEWLRGTGMTVAAVDAAGDWAEVNEPRDIAHFVLGTKAETLKRLRGMVSSAVIQDQVAFTVEAWTGDRVPWLTEIRHRFAGTRVVVRSSARSEDSFTTANAGAYTSLLDVDHATGLESAVEAVIASYHEPQPDDQVLVQPMVTGVVLSGVAFTRTLERGAPYYVINYDETGGTDGITAGSSREHRTLFALRGSPPAQLADARLAPLITAMREIEELLGHDVLDIEFALNAEGQVHILQVRPIAVAHVTHVQAGGVDEACIAALEDAKRVWERLRTPAPHLAGGEPVYGIMPDWNPAEIIGTSPGRLAESLYRHLIMDEVWATQRAEFGYRDVRPQPLLTSFAGRPYVDVRASFHSFLPAVVPDDLAGRLVSFYLRRLCANPHFHDKVEFEVLPTCLSFAFGRWEQRLRDEGFSDGDVGLLREGLSDLTVHGFKRTAGDLETVKQLEVRLNAMGASTTQQAPQRAQMLLTDCKRLGTLPFAHLARSGFIAMTLLREAVVEGVISEGAKESFLATLRTVSHEFTSDARAVAEGHLEWDIFASRYGHLRPGTYDLTSPCYAADTERFLRPVVACAQDTPAHEAAPERWEAEKGAFFAALGELGLPSNGQVVEAFLRQAMEGRERAKFVFTRALSMALEAIAQYGRSLGLDREKLAHVPLQALLPAHDDATDAGKRATHLRALAEEGRRARESALSCALPPLLFDESHFHSFVLTAGAPNFIGSLRVTAVCTVLTEEAEESASLAGRIVLVPQADPGYDWIFGQGIAGLITMYGGANSHMAIRAAEFGLPAAIGVGEQLYGTLAAAAMLELDPGNGTVRVLR